jgi:hypothetical protein
MNTSRKDCLPVALSQLPVSLAVAGHFHFGLRRNRAMFDPKICCETEACAPFRRTAR